MKIANRVHQGRAKRFPLIGSSRSSLLSSGIWENTAVTFGWRRRRRRKGGGRALIERESWYKSWRMTGGDTWRTRVWI